MAIMERWTQKMTSEKAWSIQIESEEKWEAVENEIGGFPAKRLYRPLAARDDSSNFIFEREWGSLAEAEAAYERLFQSPQAQSIVEEIKAQAREEGIENLVETYHTGSPLRRQITSAHVLEVLKKAMAQYGVPGYIRSDNGCEFIANKVQAWLKDHHIKTIYIDPASPWQNGYIESFHSRFRDECLNREWLLNLREARVGVTPNI